MLATEWSGTISVHVCFEITLDLQCHTMQFVGTAFPEQESSVTRQNSAKLSSFRPLANPGNWKPSDVCQGGLSNNVLA
jgi:hypothetical protein